MHAALFLFFDDYRSLNAFLRDLCALVVKAFCLGLRLRRAALSAVSCFSEVQFVQNMHDGKIVLAQIATRHVLENQAAGGY